MTTTTCEVMPGAVDKGCVDVKDNVRGSVVDVGSIKVKNFSTEIIIYCSGTKNCTHTPMSDIYVSKIVDGKTVIWEGKPTLVHHIQAIYERNKVCLVSPFFINEDIHFFYSKIHGVWNTNRFLDPPPESEIFYNVPNHMKPLLFMSIDKYAVNMFGNLRKRVYNSVTILKFTPEPECNTKMVLYNKDIIWETNKNSERCVKAVTYFDGELPIICKLLISDGSVSIRTLYYEYKDSTWNSVGKADFDNHLKLLKNICNMREDADSSNYLYKGLLAIALLAMIPLTFL